VSNFWGAPRHVASLLPALRPGQTVRVRTNDGRRVESRVRDVDNDPLALRLADLDTPLSPTDIDSLWVRGRAVKNGAIVGAVSLGAAGFIAMGVVCEAFGGGGGEPIDPDASDAKDRVTATIRLLMEPPGSNAPPAATGSGGSQ